MAGTQEGSGRSGEDRGDPPVGRVVASVGHRVASGFRRALPDDLHPRQYAVLQHLWDATDSPPSQRALAGELGIPQSGLVALVDDLESRGWVERTAAASDRRIHLITLTRSGAAAADRARACADDYEDELTSRLAPEERAMLLDLLARLGPEDSDPAPRMW